MGGNILKIYNKIAYLVIIVIVIAAGFFLYKVFGEHDIEEQKSDKTLSEVKYLESKFQDIFNQLNNIKFENYEISSSKVEESESSGESGSSGSGSESSSGSSSSSGGGSSSSSEGGSKKAETPSDSKESNKQFKLEETGVLTKTSDIDWKKIKNQVEVIYTSLYSTTIDLYQTSANQEDITGFNKQYDNLTKAIKEENKENSLKELSILYNYLPGFVDSCTNDEKERTVIRTKNNIFKAYSILEQENWDEVSKNINDAVQEFTKLVTNISTEEKGNQYNINKTYVMINELQNSVNLKDKEVFLIKYKNLIQELQNL